MKVQTLAFAFLAFASGAALAQEGGPRSRIAALDTNKDGAITLEEARAPRAAAFSRLDTNSDGSISKQEAEAGRDAMRQRAPGGPGETERRGRGGHGEGFARMDANGDQLLTRDEFINAPNPMFQRFDENKNGVLEAAELAKLPQRGQRS